MNRFYSYHFKQTFRRGEQLSFNQYNMAGADGLGLIFSLSQPSQHPGHCWRRAEGSGLGSKTEFFFFSLNKYKDAVYEQKMKRVPQRILKLPKIFPSALAKGNTARLSMESIIVHGEVQGGRSA